MRSTRLNYVIVGLFVSAMVAGLVAWLGVLSGGVSRGDSYVMVMDNVAEVKFGTQVRFEGYPVGQVEAIEPVPDGGRMRFRVEVSVENGWRIPRDSVARIGSSSFLAAKTVDITSGRSADVLSPGGEIRSAPPADIFAAMSTAAGEFRDLSRGSIGPMLDGLGDLVGDARRELLDITGKLKTNLDSLQAVLSPDNVESLGRIIRNAETASDGIAGMTADLQVAMTNVNGVIADLDAVVDGNRENIDATLTDTRYVMRSLAATIGTISHNLESTSRNLNEFSRLIRQNPGLLLGGSPRDEVTPTRGTVQ